MRFSDQIVWITGASSGIGAALARALAREGASLVLTARRAEALAEVAAACAPAPVHVLPADLLDLEALPDLAARAAAAFGRVDVLINNAGVSQRGTALDTDDAVLGRIMDLNFRAPVALARAVLPAMVARGSGAMMVTSSLAGRLATPRRSAYSASKHALEAWCASLRAELHDTGVDVIVVAPGYIATGLSTRALSADGSAHGSLGAGDAHGLSPEACAARMLDALHRRTPDVMIGGREVWAVRLARLAPWLVRRILHRAAPADESGP